MKHPNLNKKKKLIWVKLFTLILILCFINTNYQKSEIPINLIIYKNKNDANTLL